jgi:hypothetical protein
LALVDGDIRDSSRFKLAPATMMIDELSLNLRELTERRRYRAWAVV